MGYKSQSPGSGTVGEKNSIISIMMLQCVHVLIAKISLGTGSVAGVMFE